MTEGASRGLTQPGLACHASRQTVKKGNHYTFTPTTQTRIIRGCRRLRSDYVYCIVIDATVCAVPIENTQ
jgi:hypothetical protein